MTNKVSVKLQGGLGNMMFQIACAHAYANDNEKKEIFATNTSITVHKNVNFYKDNIFRNIELVNSLNIHKFTIFNERTLRFNNIPKINGDVLLEGYFQSEKYFNKHKNDIKKLFEHKPDTVKHITVKYKNLLSKNTCSIHVRRGDYLKYPNHHPVQNIDYYMKSIKQMPKDSVFLIFSDDIQWCKEMFPDLPEKFIFIKGNNDYEDLALMSMCNNNIIANSSFSWWGAWLNGNDHKKVIAPKKWFGEGYGKTDAEDIYCNGWIKI